MPGLNTDGIDNKLSIPKKEILDLLHFKSYVGEALILSGKVPLKKRGRPSQEPTTPLPKKKKAAGKRPINEVRYDGIGHFPDYTDQKTQARCKNEGCKGRT